MPNLADTILTENGAYVEGAHKVVDSPIDNIALGALGCCVRQTAAGGMKGLVNQILNDKVSLSWGRDARMVKHKAGAVTGVTNRNFTVIANENESSYVGIVFGYVGFNMKMYEQNYRNSNGGELNEISYRQDMSKKLQAGFNFMKEDMERSVLAACEDQKTKIVNRPLGYDFVGDSLVVTYAQKDEIFKDVKPIMTGNNYDTGDYLDLIGTVGTEAIMLGLSEHGEQNDQNKAIRLQGKQLWVTNSIPKNPGKYANFFAVPDGCLGMVTRRQPNCVGNVTTKDWDFTTMPGDEWGIPFPVEVRKTTKGVDSTTETGNDRNTTDAVTEMQIGVDYAILVPFEAGGAEIPSPVIECQINTVASDNDTTSPTVLSVASADKTELTVQFSEVLSFTADGGTLLADAIEADKTAVIGSLTVTGGNATIDDIAASEDSTAITITLTDTALVATDTITATSFYDVAGNQYIANSGAVARVNAGNTAWEAIP